MQKYPSQSGPSTVQGPNTSNQDHSALNIGVDNSQSRIKVDLSQQENDQMAITGMEEESDHIKPTLMADPFRSDGSTPHVAPMHEMN